MELYLRVGDIVLVDEKDKAYINRSGKDGCAIVCYLVSACQKKVSWTLMVSYFNEKPEEGNGGLGDRKTVITERAGRSPRDEESREAIF